MYINYLKLCKTCLKEKKKTSILEVKMCLAMNECINNNCAGVHNTHRYKRFFILTSVAVFGPDMPRVKCPADSRA